MGVWAVCYGLNISTAFFISQHKKVGSHMELKKLCGFADVNINNV